MPFPDFEDVADLACVGGGVNHSGVILRKYGEYLRFATYCDDEIASTSCNDISLLTPRLYGQEIVLRSVLPALRWFD